MLGAALQEQWRRVGVDLELRPLEFATVLSDAIKDNLQLIFCAGLARTTIPIFSSLSSARSDFRRTERTADIISNARVDALTDQIRIEMDQAKRKVLCSEVQKILADDLPYLPLWFTDATSVHRKSLGQFELSPTGDFDFLAGQTPNRRHCPKSSSAPPIRNRRNFVALRKLHSTFDLRKSPVCADDLPPLATSLE